MEQKSFKRGVHPYEGKELSMNCPIRIVAAEDVMIYPLSQNIGASSKTVVAVGDRVLKGQLIAEAGGPIGSPIFSSVSGIVKAIEKRLVVNGNTDDCIIIENDKQDETVSDFGRNREPESLSAAEIIDIIKGSGIVGLGGAGFPTGVKISPKNSANIDTLIINGAECEPYLTSDYRLMLEKSDEIIRGIRAVLKTLPNARAVIGIENNKPEAVRLLEKKTAGEDRITVCPLKTKYPQGGERQLIYAITGRRISSKMLPADKGCIVLNIASCYAIYEAVYKCMPLIHKVMTVTGEAVNAPCNVDVSLGVSHSYVLKSAGGAKDDVVKFISGGPMMGMAMGSLDVPVIKTSSSILAFSEDDIAALPQSSCIHCGRCVKVCPQILVVQMLAKAVKAENFEKFEALGGMECIECGSCSYICPAKIPLTQMCRLGKAKVREMRTEK